MTDAPSPAAAPQPARASEIEILTREAVMAPDSVDEESRTIEATFSSGAPVKRRSWSDGEYTEVLSMKPEAVRLERMNRGAPFIDSHNYWGGAPCWRRRAWLGAHRKGRLGRPRQILQIRRGRARLQDAKDGVLRNLSLGYIIHKHEVDDTTKPPTRTAMDWEPHEISAVAISADPRAQFRSAEISRHRAPPAQKEVPMSNTPAAQEVSAENRTAAPPVTETRAAPAPAPVAAPAAPALDQRAIDEAVAAGIRADLERRDAITDCARKLGLPDSFAEQHRRASTSLDAFRVLAIDEAAKIDRSAPTNAQLRGFDGGFPSMMPHHARKDPQPGEYAMRMIAAVAMAKKNRSRPSTSPVITTWATSSCARCRLRSARPAAI